MIKPLNLGLLIGRLGGKVVFAGKRGTLASGVTCYNLSKVPVRGEEVYDSDWVGNMVVAGRGLSREKWLGGDSREEDFMPCSQVARIFGMFYVCLSILTTSPSRPSAQWSPRRSRSSLMAA